MAYRRFDDEQAREIKEKYATTKDFPNNKKGKVTIRQLMKEYGGTYSTIWNIVNGIQYKDIKIADPKNTQPTDTVMGSNPTDV